MTKKRPPASPYPNFDAIEIGSEVHLRIVGESLTDAPTYENAKLISQPSGRPGMKNGTFFVPSLGYSVPNITEAQYVAWTRY